MGMHERRRWPRAELHWTVQVFVNGQGNPLVSRTKNLSSRGFYCHVHQAVNAGEQLQCSILIPARELADTKHALSLECRARVLRVEAAGLNGGFGIACQIEDYSVISLDRGRMLSAVVTEE